MRQPKVIESVPNKTTTQLKLRRGTASGRSGHARWENDDDKQEALEGGDDLQD